MFSPLAQWALSSETRGQNSFVNYSGVNEVPLQKMKLGSALKSKGKKDGNKALVAEGQKLIDEANGEFQYADQKAVILKPEHNDFSEYYKPKQKTETPPPEGKPPLEEGIHVEKPKTVLTHKGLQELATEFGMEDITPRERQSRLRQLKEANDAIDEWKQSGTY